MLGYTPDGKGLILSEKDLLELQKIPACPSSVEIFKTRALGPSDQALIDFLRNPKLFYTASCDQNTESKKET